jgi:ribose transport system permease protein
MSTKQDPPGSTLRNAKVVHRSVHALRAVGARQLALTTVAALLFAYFSAFGTHFLTLDNIYDMARLSTYMLIVGVPLTFVFVASEIDISIGSAYGLTTVVMAVMVANWGFDPWLAAALTVVAGAIIGCINGFACAILGVPSLIFTLGMFSLLRGAAYVVTGGQPLDYPADLHSSFFAASSGAIDGMPVQIVWALAVFVIGAVVLHFTVFGAHVYATGGNETAARASGIATRRVKFLCFVATSAACGLAGALTGGWLLEGSPDTGTGFELQLIAAVIIGGVAITGGAGNMYGTLLGVAIIGMLANGLVLVGAQANWTEFFVGLIIVIVASAEIALRRRGAIARRVRELWRSPGLRADVELPQGAMRPAPLSSDVVSRDERKATR